MIGIDPEGVVIVAAWSASSTREGHTGVGGPIESSIRNVKDVFVLWVDFHLCKVAPAAPNPLICLDASPGLAGVLGAIQSSQLGSIDESKQSFGLAWCNGDPNAAKSLFDR